MIDLTKFCDPDNMARTSKPFSKGEWTYATNRYICIRVPRLHVPQFLEKEDPDAERIFKEADKDGPVYHWVSVPEVELKTVRCKECDGTGKVEDSNHLVEKCTLIECDDCGGKGQYQEPNPIRFQLGAVTIGLADIYLDLIRRELPNPQIGLIEGAGNISQVTHRHYILRPVKIKFDGGEGLLMPMAI